MRLPFFHPRRDEVAAIATDLIKQFGLRAHEEASYLAGLSLQMGSRRKRILYESVAREIDASFREAQRQRNLRQSASNVADPGGPVPGGNDGGPEHPGNGMEPARPTPHIRPYALGGLIAELNRVDRSRRRARPLSAHLPLTASARADKADVWRAVH
jgi:hypothetical protein